MKKKKEIVQSSDEFDLKLTFSSASIGTRNRIAK